MSRKTRSRRPLIALLVLILGMTGAVAAGAKWSSASFEPKLALDLAGGTQIILTPKLNPGERGTIDANAINQAIEIIRQRVDSSGVSEAEITSQGGRNIVVSLPGDPTEQAQAIELVSQSAQMRFRPVLYVAAGAPEATPEQTPSEETPAEPTPSESAPSDATPSQSAPAESQPAAEPTTQNRAIPQAFAASTPAATTPAASEPAASEPAASEPAQSAPAASEPAADPSQSAAADPSAGTSSDLSQITEEVYTQFQALDCSDPAARTGGEGDDPKKVLVTCSQDGAAKYILGPVEIEGSRISEASAGMGTNSQGSATGEWVVNLSFDSQGAKVFRDMSQRLLSLQSPQNQFAIVLDGLVVSAPQMNALITDGKAQISGSFTQESSNQLANQLRFGALPMSFTVQSSEQISALLGSEQLRNGVLAGIIGLILVVIYSLIQYRALGLVTVASLVVTGLLTYLSICLLSWGYGYRLSLPGVTGLIIAIGVTADSFIVYFERIRDEVRDGRSLVAAVETGWARARRTIIASDAINLLAAVVLYLLAVGGVRGFAFTLGLTTILDLLVVILFTHPLVSILARTKFFGGGHKLSGFDPEHLGRAPAYAGRGRVRSGEERMTIAQRKAAERRAAEEADPPPDDDETLQRASLTKES